MGGRTRSGDTTLAGGNTARSFTGQEQTAATTIVLPLLL